MSDNKRLEDLEIKVAFVENTIAELDEVVRSFGDQLEKLRDEIRELRETMEPDEEAFDMIAEKPPHY